METNTNIQNNSGAGSALSAKRNTIIFATAGFLIGAIAGYGLSFVLQNDLQQDPNQNHEALKQAVREQYPEYFEQEGFGTFYSGTVEKIEGNTIFIKTEIPDVVLLASDIKETREITVDEDTQIIKETQKDENLYARELAEYETAYGEYQSQIEGLSEDVIFSPDFEIQEPAYPDFETREEITINEIKAGNLISVSVQGDGLLVEGEEAEDATTSITIREDISEEAEPGEEI